MAAVNNYHVAIKYINNPTKDVLISALLKLLKNVNINEAIIDGLLNKYSDRNYPEFDINRKSYGEIK